MKAAPVSFIGFFYFLFFSTQTHAQKEDTTAIDPVKNNTFFTTISETAKQSTPKNKKEENKFSGNDSASAYSFVLRNAEAPLRQKLWHAEKLIGGAEVAGMGILILLPKKITKWQDDWMQDALRNLKRSWTNMPVWDKDDWGFNYLGHPVAGSYYYNAIRSQNASVFSSFAFSAFQSTLWEYVVEGIAERPSIQDLFITPIGGAILGEVTHRVTLKMQRRGFTIFEKAFVLVFNPMYAINNGFKKKYHRIPLYN